ncbi:MAG TPA: hypothetical protein PK156_30155 [Polyangium sp.]|nr:hypothetical protein [Polyangium sp.]
MTSSTRRLLQTPPTPLDDEVLADPRWDALLFGEATPEQIDQLREWAERSEVAKAAWLMFQPVEDERLDDLANGILRELEICDKTGSISHSQLSATSAPTERKLEVRDEKPHVCDKKVGFEGLSKKTIDVYLIANDGQWRSNLARALHAEAGMKVVVATRYSATRMSVDFRKYKPDVVLVDFNVLSSGWRMLRWQLGDVHRAKLFAFSIPDLAHARQGKGLRARLAALRIRGGDDNVHGAEVPSWVQEYRVQIAEVVDFTSDIPQLSRNETPLGQRIAEAVANATRESSPEWTRVLDALTPDEREVVELLILGKSKREIIRKFPRAKQLVQSVYQKLGCKNETELTHLAMGIESHKRR